MLGTYYWLLYKFFVANQLRSSIHSFCIIFCFACWKHLSLVKIVELRLQRICSKNRLASCVLLPKNYTVLTFLSDFKHFFSMMNSKNVFKQPRIKSGKKVIYWDCFYFFVKKSMFRVRPLETASFSKNNPQQVYLVWRSNKTFS